MIVGIGLDIVEVARVAGVIDRRASFLRRVYTPAELAYCWPGERHRYRRLAARFAAKEATLKALGIGLREVRWTDMEVLNDALGKPQMHLRGPLAQVAQHRGVTEILLSLSHSHHYAVAQVVAVGGSERGRGGA